MTMWIVCLGLLVVADAASLGRRPLDIPVEVVYDSPAKALENPIPAEKLTNLIAEKISPVGEETQEKEPAQEANSVSLRNLDEKIQLSQEEVAESEALTVPENVAKIEKVPEEPEVKQEVEVASDESESKSSSEENSKEESDEEKDEKKEDQPAHDGYGEVDVKQEPEVLMVNDAPREEVKEEVKKVEEPAKVEVPTPQQDVVVEDKVEEKTVEVVLHDEPKESSEVPEETKEKEPEVKFEEIDAPSIASDSQVLEKIQEQVADQVQKIVEEHVDKHIAEKVEQQAEDVPEVKTIDVPLPEKNEPAVKDEKVSDVPALGNRIGSDEKEEKKEVVEEKESKTVLSDLPEVPVEKETENKEEKVEEPKTVVVQDEPEKKDEDVVKARQLNDAEAAEKPEPPKQEGGPFSQITSAISQFGQNVQNIFSPQTNKPEDESGSSESWVAGLQQNFNNQLTNFNSSFNEFLNNIRPNTPSNPTQNDETTNAQPANPLLDGVQNVFNSQFQSFQNNVNNAISGAANLFQGPNQQKPQNDEAASSPQNILQTGFQNAVNTFSQALNNVVGTFQNPNQNPQTQNDEAGSQNNLGGQIINAFQSGINNLAQVFNPRPPGSQSDEATQGSSNPLQAIQSAISGVGQQISNFVSGQTQQSIPTNLPSQGIPTNLPSLTNLTSQNIEKPLQQIQEGITNVAGSASQAGEQITNALDSLPKPETPQLPSATAQKADQEETSNNAINRPMETAQS